MSAGQKRVICISWDRFLSESRELLLKHAGYEVLSAAYENGARRACKQDADLLILGHSVPQEEKRWIIECFRQHSNAPVLSLLAPWQQKLPEATYGVHSNPEDFLRTVNQVLRGELRN